MSQHNTSLEYIKLGNTSRNCEYAHDMKVCGKREGISKNTESKEKKNRKEEGTSIFRKYMELGMCKRERNEQKKNKNQENIKEGLGICRKRK